MASSSTTTTTSLFFKSSSNNNNNNNQAQPDPTPTPKPRPRTGRGRGQKGPTKPPQRGMGIHKTELEIERRDGSSPTHRILAAKFSANHHNLMTTTTPPAAGPPLHGFPVHLPLTHHQYYFTGQPDPSTLRPVGPGPSTLELPSMPNNILHHHHHHHNNNNNNNNNALSYKKKRVNNNGEEENEGIMVVGFGGNKGKEKQFVGDHNYEGFNANYNPNYGDYYHHLCYDISTNVCDEMMTTQKTKLNVTEYGFFPENSDTSNVEHQNTKHYNANTNTSTVNNYYLDYLDLKLGCSDTSHISSSPSSSLTTATNYKTTTTTTTTTTNGGVCDTSLDLSLKLSNY